MTTISRLLMLHTTAERSRRARRGRRVGLDERSALAVAHVLCARELTPWQLARRLSLGTAETVILMEALERDGYLTHMGTGRARNRFAVRATPLAQAAFAPPAQVVAERADEETRMLLRRFIATAAEATEREADRLARTAIDDGSALVVQADDPPGPRRR